MKETLKRLTCMLLALIMVAGMFPVSVFAETENPISVDAGSTVSNVIGPIGVPEVSQEPAQVPVEEVVEEPAEVVPEVPVFDASQPIKYRVENAKTFSLLSVLKEAGAPVNTITGMTGELAGKSDATPINGDWRLTPYNYFDSVELSVTAKNAPDGEEAVYTVILSNPDPNTVVEERTAEEPAEVTIEEAEEPAEEGVVSMPAVTLTATVDSTTVTVEVPEEALPAGVQMRVKPVDARATLISVLVSRGYFRTEAKAAVDALIESGYDISEHVGGYNIAFYLPEAPEIEIEPQKEVTITYSNLSISTDSQENLGAYHVGETGIADKLDVDVSGGNGSFTTTVDALEFTDYPIIDETAVDNALNILGAQLGDREGVNVDEQIRADAYDLYNTADGEHNPMVSVRITPSFTGDVLAGDLIEYTVGYTYQVIDTWQNSNEEWIQYFREFYDNKVVIHLPAGLLMPRQSPTEAMFELDPNDPTNDNLSIDHYYTIWLNVLDPEVGPEPIDPQGGTLNGDFTIKVYVGNNGTANSIHNVANNNAYDLPDDLVTISTKFDILGEDGNPLPEEDPSGLPATYEHHDTATARDVTTTSPDEWLVEKTGVPSLTKLSDDGKTVTFTWDIEIGLKDGGSLYELDDKYGRNGRDLLESMTLNDLFETILSLNNTDVTGQETTPNKFTIKKSISQTGWGPAVTFTNDEPILIWDGKTVEQGSTVNPNLIMNSKNLVDSDGNGSLDQLTAKYTKYRVTVTYPVKDPDWIAQFPDAAAYTLTQTNKATITPVLAKKTHNPVSSEDTRVVTLPVAGATTLNISKILNNYLGQDVDYTDDLYGVIPYEITSANTFTVYDEHGQPMRTDEGGYMSGSNSYVLKSGVTYYLAPGIPYTVKENMTDAQKAVMTQTDNPTYFDKTPEAGKPWNVIFHNKEVVGKIIITKKDDAKRKMTDLSTQQAGFTLYDSTNTNPIQGFEEQFTDNTATATFVRVPYGTYYIRETTVPPGYVGSDAQQVTVSETDDGVAEIDIFNTQNKTRVILQKYVGTTTNEYSVAPSGFGSFELQRTTDDPTSASANWVAVTGIDSTVGTGGRLLADVDAFDANHNPYYYRFVETIPAGYYDPASGKGAGQTVNSGYECSATQDSEGIWHAIPVVNAPVINMYNLQLMKIHLNKTFYTCGTNGRTTGTENKSTTVTLWSTTDYVNLTRIKEGDEADAGQTVSNTVYADWTNLPLVDSNGNALHYLIREADVYSYFLDDYGKYEGQSTDKKWTIHEIDGVKYVEVPMAGEDSATDTENMTIWNRQNAMPAVIWKKNYYSNSPVVSNDTQYVKVTIWKVNNDGTLSVAESAKTQGTFYENVKIQTAQNSGTTFYLEPGYKYVFQEVENTTGLEFHSYVNGSSSTGATRQETINGQVYGVLDLSSYSQTYANRGSNKIETRTVNNAPKPNIQINKVDSVDTTTSVSGAQFAVYTYNSETGKYDPYPDAANQVTITTTNEPSGVRSLTAGETYYFAETVVPTDYMNPNIEANYNAYYKDPENPDTYFWGQTAAGEYKTFFKGTVTNNKVGNDNVCIFTFKNVKNAGSVKVLKYLDGTLTNGYTIVITDSNGVEIARGETTGTGANKGSVTFSGLKVLDDSGNKIVYTVTEDLDPTTTDVLEKESETCVMASEDQTVSLIIGQTVTKDGSTPNQEGTDNTGDTLAVYNTKRISFSGTKVYRKAFEYEYTHFETPVEGAVIGLFIKNETTGNWDLVPAADLTGPKDDQGNVTNPATTNSNGGVTFTGLVRGKDYAMVELSAGEGNEHMFPYPFSLAFPSQGVGTTSILADEISGYNVRYLNGDDTKVDPDKETQPTAFPTTIDPMINSNHWVQFDITKWLDPRLDPVLDEEGHQVYNDDGTPKMKPHYANASEVNTPIWPNDAGQLADGTQLTEVDHVVFKLYRYIMPEGVTSVDFTKEYVEGEGWDLVGTPYTTGTLYIDNVRQAGRFITDSDQNIDKRYVYMLVEESVGPNSIVMNPNFRYTFYHEETTNYTVNLTGDAAGYVARNNTYKMDYVNPDDILDSTPVGPGTSLEYLASVRIAKYQDSYNPKTGYPNKDYQPLYGAQFTLSLADGTVIDTMTVGLDSQLSGPDGLSLAQSGTFRLILPHTIDNPNDYYILEDFANEKEYHLTNVEPFSFEQDGVTFEGFRTPVVLTETYVPDGYSSFLSGGLDMWLCFVNILKPTIVDGQTVYNGESWVFNDAYFVLTVGTGNTETLADNQSAISWYVTNATSGAKYYTVAIGDTENPSKLRIVNYPTTNTPARIVKYGYTPSATTVAGGGMTAEQLDEEPDSAINREPLQNVEMVIQVQDGSSWKYWNYKTNEAVTAASAATFTTDEHGIFSFPQGLPEGTYRIYETGIGAGNEAYEMAYPQARARVFTVTKAVVDLSFYNPVKIDMKMIKQDMDGNVVSELSDPVYPVFVLKKNNTVTYTADKNNNYTFKDVETGTYVLTETVAGYSSAYLTQYLTSNYADFATFATSGTAIGYTYSNTGHTGEYVVSAINPSATNLTPPTDPTMDTSPVFTLTIKNPKLTGVRLLKSDLDNTSIKLSNAEFEVFYLPFNAISGSLQIPVPQAQEAGNDNTARQNTAKAFTDAGWERLRNGNNYGGFKTNADGVLILTEGGDPGVYAFYEYTAPANYEILKDTSGKVVIYTAVVTGGLPVTVTVNPSSAVVDDYTVTPKSTKEITTTAQSADGTTVVVDAYNRAKVPLKALKQVKSGEITLTTSNKWTITLKLYSDEDKTNLVGVVTINESTSQGDGITFKVPNSSGNPTNTDAAFGIGETYYLEETITTPTSQFVLEEVLKGNVAVEVAESGLYEFLVDNTAGFTITAVNDWLWGEVTFEKVDASDTHKVLTGATFEVQYNKNAGVEGAEENWVKLDNSSVTETPEGSGIYVAKVPLVSAEATTYRIAELTAPPDYVFVPGTHVDVELSLADNIKTIDDAIVMKNSEGNGLRITKHNNAYGAAGSLDATNATHFAVYHKVDNAWVFEEDGYTTDGVYVYTRNMLPGDEYAIAEVGFDTSAYNRLDGIYSGTTKLIPEEEKVTFNGKEYDLYPLPVSETGDLTIDAYNIPYIKPEIRKIDVGQYLGGADYPKDNIEARMNYAVYEITENDGDLYALTGDAQPTRAQVEAFLLTKTDNDIVTSGTTGNYDSSVLRNGTRAFWEETSLDKRWDNTKSYLLVETQVAANGGTYDTLRKDDARVVWFYRTPKVENADLTTAPIWTLQNVYGDANVVLKKAPVIGGDNNDIFEEEDTKKGVIRATIESLLTDSRNVAFTITPTVTSQNQMLDAFVLKEAGITAKGIIDANGTIGDISADYTFTKVNVGSASHQMNADFGVGTEPTISALVTFYSTTAMADTDVLGTENIDDISSNQDVTAPAGTKAFTISYYSTPVRTATESMCDKTYSLGEQFSVTSTTVYAVMTKIPEATAASPAKEITQITNHSRVDLDYWKWSKTGEIGDKPENKFATADADVYVKSIAIPMVKITKAVEPSVTSINNTVVYTITVSNSGNSEADFVNPIVLDILPTAVTYVADSVVTPVQSTAGDNVSIAAQVIAGGESTSTEGDVKEKENAILFKLTGKLVPGASVDIKYTAKVTKSSELFADVVAGSKILCNDAYVTSAGRSYHTMSNPQGWPFTDENEDFGDTLANEAASLNDSPSASRREDQMEGSLTVDGVDYGDENSFAWLSNTIHTTLNKQSRVRLVKAVQADRDLTWHDEKVGVASRTNGRFGTVGWVDWRLGVTNGYSDRNIEGLILGDVIPRPDDGQHRLSQWYLNFFKLLKVENNGEEVPASDYTVYFYTGDTANAEQAVKDAMSSGNLTGFKTVDQLTAAPVYSGSNIMVYPEVTAFLVVFKFTPDATDNVVLVPGASLILTYETKVKDVQDDTDFSSIAFRNDSNYFFFYYRNVNEPMQSNTVSVTLTDIPVEIQGDLWIDEDWDGEQNSEANYRDYSEYTIVQNLANAFTFSITDKRAGAIVTHPSSDSGDMSQWDGGESIKHFRFEDLGAAAMKLGVTEPYSNNSLNVGDLKGDDPYNYILDATLGDISLLNIFSLSQLGNGHYKSDDPDSADFVNHTAANFRDNNFYDGSETGSYTTSPFFIRYSNNIDQSKDIGFKMCRTLDLTKLAQDQDVAVEGAEFQVFGPYKDRTLGNEPHTPAYGYDETNNGLLKFTKVSDGVYKLDPSGRVTTLVTGSDGKIKITGLNWWKEYDIKELSGGPGYDVAGATVTAGSGTDITGPTDAGKIVLSDENNTFTLLVPSTKTKTDPIETVTVKDPRRVEVQLEVEKILKMYSSEDMTFEFIYWLTTDPNGLNDNLGASEDDPIQSITVTVTGTPDQTTGIRTAIGSFDTIELNGAGTYVFSIKEIPDKVGNPNIKYDEATKTATVVVEWDSTAKKLVVKSITYSDPVNIDGKPVTYTDGVPYIVNDQGQSVTVDAAYEGFTNEYESEPVEATPQATKSLSGEEVSYDITFTFKLTADTVVENGAYVDYDPTATNTAIKKDDTWSVDLEVKKGQTPGIADFDEITYTLPGTYIYSIEETATSPDPHFEYATVKWTYTVVVNFDTDGNLVVTSEKYTPDDDEYEENDDAAEFINKYTPTPVEWIPQAKKLMAGDPIPEAKKFKFQLTETSDPNEGAALPTTTEIEVEVAANAPESPIGKFADTVEGVLHGIKFTKAGTYTFQVEEVVPTGSDKDPNIEYTNAKVTFTVTVVDNNGQLEVTNVVPAPANMVDKDGITVTAKFTNTYTPKPTDYTPKVMKKITGGKTEEEIAFNFEITAGAGAYTEDDTSDDYTNPEGASLTAPTTVEIRIPAGKIDVLYDAAFGNIHFTKAGTFKFTVIEVKPGEGQEIEGMVYADTVYTLTVVVTDNKGQLEASASYNPAGYDPNTEDEIEDLYALFVNDYEVKPTGYTPEVSKSMTMSKGKTKEDKTFTFTMTADSNNPAGATIKDNGTNPGNKATVVVPAGSTDSVTAPFGGTPAAAEYYAIEFTAAGTYVFTIVEDIPSNAVNNKLNGVTYDPAEWTLTVVVENQNSQLVVKSHNYEPKQSDSAHQMNSYHAVFLNDYTPEPTDYTPSVNKSMTMSKGKTTEDKTFTFTMTNPDGLTIDSHDGLAGTAAKLVIPAGSEATVEAFFGKIHFTEEGEYSFTITEDIPGGGVINPVNGITFDPVEWTLKVVVKDNNGKLEIEGEPTYTPDPADNTHAENSDHAVFLNEATPKPTDLKLPVKKTLEGINPPEEVVFTFDLTLKSAVDEEDHDIMSDGTSSPTSSTATVTMTTAGTTKTTNFETIEYTAVGTYTYEIVETVTTPVSGMTYDKAKYEVTVTVTSSKDELSATYTIKQTMGSDGVVIDPVTKQEILFINEYKPEPVKEQLHARKELTGETWPLVYDDVEFEFSEIYLSGDLTGFTVTAPATMPTQADDVVETFTISGPDAVTGKTKDFSLFTFTKPGSYKFEIKETKHDPEVPGVLYDLTVWEATIEIEDGGDGKLKVKSVDYEPMLFKPDGIHEPNKLLAFFTNGYDNGTVPYTPKVEKKVTVEYGPLVQPKTFNFELAADENNPAGASLTAENGPDTAQIIIAADGTSGSKNFKQITFTSASPDGKPFKFTATEKVEGENGIIYSGDIWTLEVTVEDVGGQLKEKHVYTYKDEDGNEHTAAEVGDVPGPTFTNKYEPKPTEYQPKVKKTVPGNRLPVDKEFTFTLTLTGQVDAKGNTMTGGSSLTGSETINILVPKGSTGAEIEKLFSKITLSKAGTYTYTVTETKESLPGITYEETVWTLTLVVVDTDGKLEVDTNSSGYSYVDEDGETHTGTMASFSNPYKPEPTNYQPLVDKTMTTEFGPTVVEKTFNFTLTLESQIDPDGNSMTDGANIPTDGDKVEIVIPAGQDNASGSFGDIEFVKAGTYTFKIEEEKPSGQNGITDDTAVWTLTVEIEDLDGKLSVVADPVYKPDKEDDDHETNSEKASFTNPYKPEPTHYQPPVDKTMTTDFGTTVEDKTFNFTLTPDANNPEDGAIIPTNGDEVQIVVPAGKNNAKGSFGEIEFVKAGTYVFEVKEVKESETGITYDGTTWTLTVEIEDLDGKLSVKSTEYKPDPEDKDHTTNADGATFTNPYKPEPTEYTPQVIKDIELVTGAPTTLEKHFTFDLKFYSAFTDDWEKLDAYQLDAAEADGGKQFNSDTVTITIPAGETHAGPIPFKTIHFTRAGRYTYKITERVTIPELGMTYDQAEWTLTVIVRDNNGKLEIADANYTSNWTNSRENREAAKFVNPYTTGNLRITKRVSGSGASPYTKFKFKVTLYTEVPGTDERVPLPGTYLVEIYNNRTGEMVDTATVENGTATFKLQHDQTAIIRNIPVGVKWEVEEEKYLGYASSAETPNKGTIQKGENISNWKNHRSTVPPVPRTGYGDGTTVKIGLFSSLGVFLASAIGSILQSKNSKKKKRGGGSHAAN